jgi:hypothetical protein
MMTLTSLSRMMVSETEGWPELSRVRRAVSKLFLAYVLPMSLIAPVMFVFSSLAYPGVVFPELAPPLSVMEASVMGAAFLLVELAMVPLMASLIQQTSDLTGITPTYEQAFTLAAIAPSPLWVAPLALFIPSVWVGVLALAAGWVGSVALIRHGVGPLLEVQDQARSRLLASFITTTGVMAWVALIIVLALMLSVIMGLR